MCNANAWLLHVMSMLSACHRELVAGVIPWYSPVSVTEAIHALRQHSFLMVTVCEQNMLNVLYCNAMRAASALWLPQ